MRPYRPKHMRRNRPLVIAGRLLPNRHYPFRFTLASPDGVHNFNGGNRMVRDWLRQTFRKGYACRDGRRWMWELDVLLQTDEQAVLFKLRWADHITDQTFHNQPGHPV